MRALSIARNYAREKGRDTVTSGLIVYGVISDVSLGANVLKSAGLNRIRVLKLLDGLDKEPSREASASSSWLSAEAALVVEAAVAEAARQKSFFVCTEHLILAIARTRECEGYRLLVSSGIALDTIVSSLDKAPPRLALPSSARKASEYTGAEQGGRLSQPSTLSDFALDLTAEARAERLDPVFGREAIVERVIEILLRRTKNNPLIIGEPGVGKTAIVEGLAQSIVQGLVPEEMLDWRIWRLSLTDLMAGTRLRGQMEERIRTIIDIAREEKNLVLFIDEIHGLVGSARRGGKLDAANMLKPALARGEIRCIGATTFDEYARYFSRDKALERRFQPVSIEPAGVEETVAILHGLRPRYEAFHRVIITDQAISAAARYASRYISTRHLPDSAIDLMDEAASLNGSLKSCADSPGKQSRAYQLYFKIREAAAVGNFKQASELKKELLEILSLGGAEYTGEIDSFICHIEESHVAQTLRSWTGIPADIDLASEEASQLLLLEQIIGERVVGQTEAVHSIASALRRARTGLRDPKRPLASLLFAGPVGVGKTELARVLAEILFGSEQALTRFDMSEYMEKHSVSKLIGAPPGYIGYEGEGQLTGALKNRPFSVLLFDEIEKAAPEIFNLFLQLLEDGRITDSHGRVVDCRNSLIIMTSNLGFSKASTGLQRLGFATGDSTDGSAYAREKVLESVKAFFRPELFNRLDEVIVFSDFTDKEIRRVTNLLVLELGERLKEKRITLTVSERLIDYLSARGYKTGNGARSVRRLISSLLENAIAEAILDGRVVDGDSLEVDLLDSEQIAITVL